MQSLDPSNRQLWKAYAIAAPVAPCAGAALVAAIGVACLLLGIQFNPAAILVMPVAAILFGIPAAYLVAGTLGMLIAFALRRRRWLHAPSILAAAFLWSVLFAGISHAFVSGAGVPASQYPAWGVYVFLLTGPPTLLSAVAFWLLLKRACHAQSLLTQ